MFLVLVFAIEFQELKASSLVIEGAEAYSYKSTSEGDLQLYVWKPEDFKGGHKRAAAIFFHGGGFTQGNPTAFTPLCRYLAHRGMIAISVQYRLYPQVRIEGCLRDAKSAIRWVRTHSEEFKIDPERLAVGGDSAGGYLAAATGLIDGFEETNEDLSVSSHPNAFILLNPALVLADVEGKEIPRQKDQTPEMMRERLGGDPVILSPYHHIREGIPPMILMHGTEDTIVPFKLSEMFVSATKAAGNRCEFIPYPGREHTFFDINHSRKDFTSTTTEIDQFLTSLGYLKGSPNIEELMKSFKQ
ncbi:MAG: alpha/beta hydrolase fold domain-containing protein [Verrucomicrobiota bacterium]